MTPALSVIGPRCTRREALFLEDEQVMVGRHERAGVVDAGVVRDERALRVFVDISER